MKKLIVISIFLLLIGTACTKGKETIINGQTMTGEVTLSKIELRADEESEFIQPGQSIAFTIIEIFEDEEGKIVENPLTEGYTIEINNKSLAKINKNNSITVQDSSLSGEDLVVTVKYKDNSYVKGYIIKKSLSSTITKDGIVTNPDSYDVVVNKQRSLPADYIPSDLVKLTVPTQLANPEINQLREMAAEALVDLFKEGKENGFDLIARSGYRSYATQDALYNSNVSSKGKAYADKYSAQPGKSEHQSGLSIDITSTTVDYQLSSDFGETPEGIWVKENAYKFGFIIRYPKGKEAIVGYEYEPWHLRYLGKELATKIYNSGLTMEEYFQQ